MYRLPTLIADIESNNNTGGPRYLVCCSRFQLSKGSVQNLLSEDISLGYNKQWKIGSLVNRGICRALLERNPQIARARYLYRCQFHQQF